jgi:pantoate--beta-alanine ligase
MSEPETRPAHSTSAPSTARSARAFSNAVSLGLVGRGRVGTALARAFADAGVSVDGPVGRGEAPRGDAVLLCVPDTEISAAAAAVTAKRNVPLVGHVSGATGLDAIAPAGAAGSDLFSIHPLQTFAAAGAPSLAGVGCAVAGSTPAALEAARDLARRAGMVPFEVDDRDRTSYHAAASMAANFLVTLVAAAETVAAGAGFAPAEARALLAPLVRQTVENWAAASPVRALTGPVARGDERTVAAQRAAVAAADRRLLPLFNVLVERTRELAAGASAPPANGRVGRRGGGMKAVRTVAELRAELAEAPRPVALVPTMGALHEGHLSLVRRAQDQAATVVVSVFVNPAQFGPGEDLAAYPRDERRDLDLAAAAGADVMFVPPLEEVYPPGFDTTVEVGGVAAELEGAPAHRGPGHFRGVATVVTKLLNMVGPDVALFGQKDAQQALVIRRLVRDLDFPVRVEVAPTVRDSDGLALSSRNDYLSPAERERALALGRALRAAEDRVARGELESCDVIAAARGPLDAAGVEPEYLELRSAEDFSPAERVNGATLLCVAARVGRARLIDNTLLRNAEPVHDLPASRSDP